MKKNILIATFALFMTTSCSKTWSGITQDTRDMFENTKEVIHEVTAPDPVIQDVPTREDKVVPKAAAVDCDSVNVIKKPVAVEPTV